MEWGAKMFPLFHLGLPLGLSEIPYIRNRFKINRLALSIGALFPDLIDKLLFFLGIGTGRYLAHTILMLLGTTLFLFLFSYLVQYLLSIGDKKSSLIVAISFFIGYFIHLMLDLPEIPLFYPFIPYIPYFEGDKLNLWIYKLFNDPIVIITELTGFFLIIFVFYKNKLYHPKQIWNYFIMTQ